ncbi:hypothetical protein L917_00003 [Phytophthora nicotianae]|uniref:Uncharacterized protein n=3 Tax=Phytophthora nicotianae TaxID=4792 RepID=W2RDD7_PHYN3|nr:hypothetical protein PPTG_00007 [Phytophthora nicotianae INRA-310]ETM03821.1 hypothetical protein L917_00003 [Phytophthora nicotianae]ETM57116.1 hypothetical protein L914_00003 [Phytophthora nicotianae]ETN23392.1 hypothetical protein PPTG_00007 [Phytophthora nicotianae INRA-310]ETO86454.1 hypothetical protein F444_00005 [Phytophthora nicotianae P1976]
MSALDDTTTYAETLQLWSLHDCSDVVNGRSVEEMKNLFGRFRAARGKSDTTNATVTLQSLDTAWTAFVRRSNKEGGDAFERMLLEREAAHSRLSVGALAAQVCQLAVDQGRRCCTAHYEDGCPRCRGRGVPRLSAAEWRHMVEDTAITEVEREVIGRFSASAG